MCDPHLYTNKFIPNSNLDPNIRENKDFDFLFPSSIPENKVSFPVRKKTLAFKFITVVSSLVLIIVLGLSSFIYFKSENQTIYIDINPSFEITTDKLDRVKNVIFYNHDAEQIIDETEIKNKTLLDAIDLIIDRCFEKGFMTEGDVNEMLISVQSDDSSKKMVEKIDNRLKNQKKRLKYEIDEITKTEKQQALEFNISPGKLKLIKKVIEKHASYSVESLKDKSVKQLQEMLKN